MEKNAEIKLSLIILISFFLHTAVLLGIFFPNYDEFYKVIGIKNKFQSGRDIIVNINQDNKKIFSQKTLLSDMDSSAKGFITKEKGDHWLNNSRDFIVKKGNAKSGKIVKKSIDPKDTIDILLTDNTQIIITLMKNEFANSVGEQGDQEFTKIPDKNSYTRKNAIFYSNDGRFSFNTKKFKNFKYFKRMKDKIAENWYPPLLANSVITSYDPITGSYTPGRVRIMAIPNQLVKLYFIMNRDGKVVDVILFESLGNRALDSSCIEAIKLSKNFGKVPEEIKGKFIVIPFMFGYYVY